MGHAPASRVMPLTSNVGRHRAMLSQSAKESQMSLRYLALVAFVCSAQVFANPVTSTAPRAAERATSYDAVNCQGAPDASVLKVSQPASSYALIYCSPRGHTVAPVDGFVWFPINRPGQPFLFNAATSSASDRPARAYFSSESSRSLSGEALEKSNAMLERGYQVKQRFSEVAQLDITTADGLLYNIFFYVENGRPIYVLGCINQCNSSALLREYSLEEAKALVVK
jgi:hypothetical protein